VNTMSTETVEVTINHKPYKVDARWSVYEACRQLGVYIPSLCHHPRLKPAGRCKVCTVHITDGDSGMFKLACSTKVKDKMKIITDSQAVKGKADTALKQVLAPLTKNPPAPRRLSAEMDRLLDWQEACMMDTTTPSLVRDMSLCIGCTRCVRACSDLQGMGILEPSVEDQGSQYITTCNGEPLKETDCILCGQCSVFCPTGAIVEKDDVDAVIGAMEAGMTVILQTAPGTRVAIAECFGAPPGTIGTRKLVGAAKNAGFHHVFDTNFTADLTIMEEGTEFLTRLEKGGPFPMFTSCCPAWINLIEKRYPQYLENLSTCRSPQMMMGPICKTYWAEKMKIDPNKIFAVSMMPCVAKKDELSRPQMFRDGKPDVDCALTTREFARLLRKRGVTDWSKVKEAEYDDPLGKTTGAAALFGVTGGVMEAALRTAYEVKTGTPLPKVDFQCCRGLDGIKEASIEVGGATLNIAIANGGRNIHKVMEWIQSGQKSYHFVEMMACPSGCIGGGGQPRSNDPDVLTRRMEAIYALDESSKLRKSHENPAIQQIYKEYFGKPLGHKSHELLHTHYNNRTRQAAPGTPKRTMSGTLLRRDSSFSSGKSILILFGSQGGTAAGAARQLKEAHERKLKSGKVRLMAMNHYPFVNLPKESTVILVCSTYGEGSFPDNAIEFWDRLKDSSLPDDFLRTVSFSVCGLGSSAYTFFNQAAKNLDKRFEELGATRICPAAFADERPTEKYMAAFDPWSDNLLTNLGGGQDSINEPHAPAYQLTLALDSKRKLERPCPPNYHFVHLATSDRLTKPYEYPRPVEFFDLDLRGSGMTYDAGAHLAILPRNPEKQVTKFLDWYGLDGEKLVSVHVVNGEPSEIPPVLTVRELFEQYMDLNAPVTKKFLSQMAVFAQQDEERKEIRRLIENPKSAEFQRFLQEYSHEDVLRMFPSALPPVENLISMIPIIKPRKYSIASSSKQHAENAHLVIVLWEGPLPSGRKRLGLCTQYLFGLDPLERPKIAAQVHEGILFPPADPSTPCMFIGLGTGIASVRAFLQERDAQRKSGAKLGKCHLWFGVRHRKHDNLFQDLFQKYIDKGVLTAVHMAYSHDDPKVFETVPMIMEREPQAVCDIMLHNDSCAYYCGPAMGIPKMCSDAMTKALTTTGGMTVAEANEHFKLMVDEERWHVECF